MSEEQTPSSDYTIDPSDRITSVNDRFVLFALQNGATDLTREHVVGRLLWDFVAGEQTRTLYEAIFERVRQRGEATSVPFRCDSPERFRFMDLSISPGEEEGALLLRAVMLREQERPYFSILERAFPRSRRTLAMCSLCKRVQILGSHWVSAEDAVRRLDLFDSAEPPRLRYTVCSDCDALAAGPGAPGAAG